MTPRRHELLIWVALVAACIALAATTPAQAVTFTAACPEPPADFTPPLPNDAAIETRELRQDLASACAAEIERADELADQAELGWVGQWFAAGLLLVLLVGPMFTAAFRFWRE